MCLLSLSEIDIVSRRFRTSVDNRSLIRSGEAPAIGWSRNMLYSGFNILPRSVVRRQTGFAARITRTLFGLPISDEHPRTQQKREDQSPYSYPNLLVWTGASFRSLYIFQSFHWSKWRRAEKGDAAHIHGSTAVYGEGFMETMTRGQSLAPGRHLCPELG